MAILRLKRPSKYKLNTRQNLKLSLHQLQTTNLSMIPTLRHRLHLLPKQLQLQSLNHLLAKLQQHKLQHQKDLIFIRRWRLSWLSVQRCSTMEQSIGQWASSWHLDQFLRMVIQSVLQDKIHDVEHSRTAMQSLSMQRMQTNGSHFVR